ncbi:MAG: sigma 54-interacting transcriptional regulator [Kiritimatiellae bacterium]|nr:sigma 54-interacting transcriptional regulator [Kiritimatiellia bacterium]MDD5523093.1 sigma 54-interacting transcriptional regulator [Kiritimatiellia bacterium]
MKQIDENKLFREVTLRISSSLEIDHALKNAHEYLHQFMPIDRIGLYYVDEERQGVYTAAEIRESGKIMPTVGSSPIIPFDENVRERIARHKKQQQLITIYNDPKQHLKDPIALKCFPELATYSTIALVLRIEHEDIGVLLISAKGPNRYTDRHIHILETVKEPIAIALSNARQYQQILHLKNLLADDYKTLVREIESLSGNQVVGAEFGLRQVMEMVRQVAPMSSPVLLLGETGTGKEVIANAIHMTSPRREAPIIRVQCGAIPETLLDSELFGHEKGAFTGAIQDKRGKFERADGGTIFLDEIAELTPAAQVKLLRVLQEKQFERLGGTKTISVDVRVIAATHRDLQEMVRKGTFREDLWFRLNVFPIHLPPLRLRKEDIPSLVQYFVERKSREMNLRAPLRLADGAMERLLSYDWPGNVRELQNVVERALILTQGQPLDFPQFVPGKITSSPVITPEPGSMIRPLSAITADHIRQTLVYTRGQVGGPGGAAELLGVNPSTLRSRMRKLGIPFGRVRPGQ